MTSFSLKNSLIALATASLGVAGCSGDAPVESAETESTGGGEAEASCGGSGEASCSGTSESEADASNETQETTEAEASCGEGSCG